ncbi:MAG: LysM peptidoglycan-binding domain-containing protein [Ardenticatenaceae bacterium]|nr:LysM peptidoglycan-binding domain-containing protein [Ardenticatenaceae bacterium]
MKKSSWLAVLISVILTLTVVTAVSALAYKVQWGDTLNKIAARFGVSVQAIVSANNISNPNLIYADQILQIPDGNATPVPQTPSPTTPVPTGGTYTVKTGDTLSAIARRFGTTIAAIAQANNISNVNLIYVGQVLTIPGGGSSPAPVTPQPNPNPNQTFGLGAQSNNLANKAKMSQSGMTWVKIQYKWQPGDAPGDLNGIIQDAHQNNFKILVSITGATSYPAANSIDFSAYTNFVAAVAALGPDAIEIWNEMNIDFEWPAGQINPSTYVNSMLAPAYNAIKAANPGVMVVSGALAPTGFDNTQNAWADDRYLSGMRAAGAASYADCIGVHHNAGATSPTVSSGHPAGTHYSWYFQPMLNLYYNTFGGVRPLCFTEVGYLSSEGFDSLPANFGWASGTSVAEQAQWVAEAAQLAANSGKVRLFIIYNLDFQNYTDTDPQAGYAIIRRDGSCPACDRLHALFP